MAPKTLRSLQQAVREMGGNDKYVIGPRKGQDKGVAALRAEYGRLQACRKASRTQSGRTANKRRRALARLQ